MAKTKSTKTTKGKTRKPAETLDERDTRTAAQRRRAREEGADRGEGEEVDNDQLPITHQTIMDHRDTQLPPEARPREGASSPAPPMSPPARSPEEEEQAEVKRDRLVQATQMGYYDHTRRRPGDVFLIRSPYTDKDGVEIDEFSERWMRDAPKGTRRRITTANQAIAQANQTTRELRAGVPVAGPFPSTPNSKRSTNPAAVTAGLDQAREDSPLED